MFTLHVTEDSESLMKLLRWCDPRVSPSLDVKDLLDAVVLADKYDMACIVSRIKEPLTDVLLGHADKDDILSIFAIAYKLRWEDLLKLAARRTLMAALAEFPLVKELELIPATSFLQLWNYHAACREALSRATVEFEPWSRPSSPLCRFRDESSDCTSCLSEEFDNPQWLESYMDKLAAYFKRPWIVPSAVYALNEVTGEDEEEMMAKCSKCKHKIQGFRELQEELLEWFDDEVQINVAFDPLWPENSEDILLDRTFTSFSKISS